MNSQKKQSSSSRATGIKTDQYGVPLNYGNYKNGRLVTVAIPIKAPEIVSDEKVSSNEIRTESVSNEEANEEENHSSTVSVITTAPEIVSDEKVSSNEIRTESVSNEEANSNLIGVAAAPNIPNHGEILSLPLFSSEYRLEQAPVFCMDSVSTENVSSNLSVAAADDDDDNIDDEIYVGYDDVPDDNDDYGVSYDRTDYVNPPSLPPETNMSCTHTTTIPHNGELLSLLLPSSVYRVEQSDKVKNNVLFHDSPKAIDDFPTHANSSPGFWDDTDEYRVEQSGKILSTEEFISNEISNIPAIRKIGSKEVFSSDSADRDNSKEEGKNSVVDDDDDIEAVSTATTAPVVSRENPSNEEVVTAPKIASNEKVISNEIHKEIVPNEEFSSNLNDVAAATDGEIVSNEEEIQSAVPTTAPVVIRTKIISTEEDISNFPAIRKIVSKEVVTADDDDDDEIINAKFQPSTVPVSVSVSVPVPITTSSTTTATMIRTEILDIVEQSEKVENDIFHDSPTAVADFPTHDNSSPGFWDDVDEDYEINNPIFYSSTVATTTTTTPVFTDIESNKEIVNVAATDDDNGLNAKSPPECKNSIGDLDGIRDVHSIMPNNGEILSLTLFSSEYRVKQAEQSYEANTDNAKFYSSTEIVPTATTSTAPVICMDSVSTENDYDEVIVLENVRQYQHRRLNTLIEVVSNLDGAAAAIDDDDGIYSRDEEYLAPAATDDDDDIHEEYPDEEEQHEELIKVLDGTRQVILNVESNIESNIESNNYDDKRKERILLPSSVSRLVKDDAVMINDGPVVESVEDTNETVVDSVEDPTARDSLKNHAVSDSKKGSSQYHPQLQKEQKKKKGEWVNNKKVKWSVDTKPPSLPTHLLPSPKLNTRSKRIPSAITAEIKAYLERAQDETTNSNGDDNCDLNNNTVQVEDVPDDNVDDDADYGEHNAFNYVDIGKEILQFKHEDLTGESETIVFYDCHDMDATQQEVGKYSIKKLYDDSILNVKLQVECENSICDLNGIQRDYSIVNEVISESNDVDPPPLFHNNHSSVDNGADVGNNVVPDTIYGAIYDRSNAENPPPLPPESLDDNVWNLEKDRSNDDNNNDFNYDDIDQDKVISESDDANPPPLPPEHPHRPSIMLHDGNNNTIGDLDKTKLIILETHRVDNNNDNSINNEADVGNDDSNPSMIPNDGERVVLLSSVSRVEKNVMVKNEVMSGRLLLSSVSRAEKDVIVKNDNDIKFDWILKWYRVDNDGETAYDESVSRYRNAPREGHLENVQRIYGYLRRFRHVDEPDYSNVHAPRDGHLENIQRIYGYLRRFRHFKLRFRVDEPDYSNVPPIQDHDWDDHAATQVEDVSEDIYDDDKYVLRKQINSNSDDGKEHDDDTFHDAIQVEDVMDDTDEERDDYGEPRLDYKGKKIVVIGPSPNEVVSRVFLTKPDERGNMKRAQVVELIDKFDDALDKDPPHGATNDDVQDNADVDDNNGEPTDDGDYGEQVNSEFYSPSEQETGPMHEGVMFAQYSNCHHEFYYESCEIYGEDPEDSEQAQSRLANSSEVIWDTDHSPSSRLANSGEVIWDTDHSPSLGDDSEFQSDFLYDQYVIERNQRLAYQGKLDNCEDVGITEAELHEAQAPLKPTIRRPDLIDYERMRKYFGHVPADIVSSMPDPYSNKQGNQPYHHDYSEQDLYGPLKHVYNRRTYYTERCLTLYIINYDVCDSSTNSGSRRRSYRSRIRKEKKKRHEPKGKQIKRKDLPQDENRLLPLIDPNEKPASLKQELQQSKCRDLLCSNQELLKRAHPNECCTMKTKDGECHMKAKFHALDPSDYLDSICLNPDPLKLIHPVFHHARNTAAAMFPDETLEVDASIEKGTIFGILGSEKRSNYCYILAVKQSEKPMNGMHVCGQTIVETSMYTMVRRVLPVQ